MCNDIHIEKSNNKVKIASYLLIFATFVLFLIRCFFGFDWSDETYYSAISYRLCLGDELFKENWDIHQLSAIITLPLVYLYKIVTGGTDGLILFMRISYTICQFATILYIYNCCKKRYKNYVSLLIATFLTFIPFAIRSFSYNTLSLLFLNLSLFLLFDAKEISKKTYKYFLSGLALALAILAYPFLIMVLPITVIYILVSCIRKKTITLKAVLLYFAGGISVITAFVAYVATNTLLSNIVKYAKFLFLDPEHQKNASISATKIVDIFSKNNVSVIICFLALVALTILYNKIGNKKEKIKDNLLIFIILRSFGPNTITQCMTFA
ncbi:MAG: glycosyltransferase family 39 protein [Oscillospiraceae bacterium]